MNSKDILKHLGGSQNIVTITHCMTRLRARVKDESLVKEEELKKISGVLGVVLSADNVQVVIGPAKVKEVTDEVIALMKNPDNDKKRDSRVISSLKLVSMIFAPLIPVLICYGIFLSLGKFLNFNIPLKVFDLFILIFIAFRMADVFNTNPYLASMLAFLMIYYNNEHGINTGIILIMLSVLFLILIEKLHSKYLANFFNHQVFLTLDVSIALVLGIFVLTPISNTIEKFIVDCIFSGILFSPNTLIRGLAGAILASTFYFMLVRGIHHILILFYMIEIFNFGYSRLLPVFIMAGAVNVGYVISIYLFGENKYREVIRKNIVSGFMGIGEPLLYGVTLKLDRSILYLSIASIFAGSYVLTKLVSTLSVGLSGILGILILDHGSIVYYLIGLIVSYISGFISGIFRIKIFKKQA